MNYLTNLFSITGTSGSNYVHMEEDDDEQGVSLLSLSGNNNDFNDPNAIIDFTDSAHVVSHSKSIKLVRQSSIFAEQVNDFEKQIGSGNIVDMGGIAGSYKIITIDINNRLLCYEINSLHDNSYYYIMIQTDNTYPYTMPDVTIFKNGNEVVYNKNFFATNFWSPVVQIGYVAQYIIHNQITMR